MSARKLKCVRDHAKSFYNKAEVYTENGIAYLRSYDTTVCSIDQNGKFRRHWRGYSATTMRHVNEFCYQYGIDVRGKAEWCALEVVPR